MLYVVHGNGLTKFASKNIVVGAFLMKSDAEKFLLTLSEDIYTLSEVEDVWTHWRLIGEAV